MIRLGMLLALGVLLGCTLATHETAYLGTQASIALAIIVVKAALQGAIRLPEFRRRLNFSALEICMIASFPILAPWLLILDSREVRCRWVKPMRRMGILGPLADLAVAYGWFWLGGGWLLGLLALAILFPVHLAALKLYGRAKSDAGIA
ncbi:MAG: hypothetical protein WEC84_01975 [Candidatus Andersenbacteria bacterium]